jgi:excisionase family DNA binding protein
VSRAVSSPREAPHLVLADQAPNPHTPLASPGDTAPAVTATANMEPLITTRELAALWSQTPRWVLRMTQEQGLPHYRLGGAIRYRGSEAEAWLQQRWVAKQLASSSTAARGRSAA